MDSFQILSVLKKYWIVLTISVTSIAFRLILIYQGGLYYFPDETKYLYSKEVATSILEGDFSNAFAVLMISAGHLGFRAVAVIPALAENYFRLPSITPTIFFSFISVFNLVLIWKIAQRIGFTIQRSYYVLFIAALSHSLIYYARHLLPYDLALCFGLISLYTGLKDNNPSSRISFFFSGFFSLLCFVTYNGYWPFASFAVLSPIILTIHNKKDFLQKTLLTFMGFMLPFILIAILMSAGSGVNIIEDYSSFAKTIIQGSYAEGWRLPYEYLWHSEHIYFTILIMLSLYSITNIARMNSKFIVIGICGFIFIYLCLFISSTILETFVVYGRLSRQLLPFLILTASQGLLILINKGSTCKGIAVTLLIILLVQAIANYQKSYNINYPREFIVKAQKQYPQFKISQKRTYTGAPSICKYKNFIITNVKYIYPAPVPLPLINESAIMSAFHPINFLPYQYEGYTPEERQTFRNEKIKMELYWIGNDSHSLILLDELKSCIATKP